MIMKKLFAATAISAFLCTSVAQAQQATFPTTSGASIATPVSVPNGGTGNASLAVGALNTGNGTGAYVPLADVATGSCLTSGGVGIMPGWGSCSSGGGGVPANLTLTNPSSAAVFTLLGGKTATINNTLTLAGTDGTTMTFPTTSATLARTDAANVFAGSQTGGAWFASAAGSNYSAKGGLIIAGGPPTISGSGGAGVTGPTTVGSSTLGFYFAVGASPTSGSFTFTFNTAAPHIWICPNFADQTTPTNVISQVAGGSTTTAVMQSYSGSTRTANAMTAGDLVSGICSAS
jgi:hypothetical protein